jgi:hypothetical protein
MNWVLIITVVLSVIGTIAWLKKLTEKIGWIPPDITWVISMPVVAMAYALVYDLVPIWAQIGVVGMSIVQLAYDNIIRLIQTKIDNA